MRLPRPLPRPRRLRHHLRRAAGDRPRPGRRPRRGAAGPGRRPPRRRLPPRRRPRRARRRGDVPRAGPGRRLRLPDRPRDRPADAAERLPDPRRAAAARSSSSAPTCSREMQSDDEIAFVLSHEASHHIAGHIGRAAAAAGARRAGPRRPRRRHRPGLRHARPPTTPSARRWTSAPTSAPAPTRRATSSRPTPLGAYVAARAGYDPERGAAIFGRPALANPGGPPILASHPASAQRQATVARVAADIRAQQAAGRRPDPRLPLTEKFARPCILGVATPRPRP